MSHLHGKYAHEKNENIDDYFKAMGVPYVARIMMGRSRPSLEISTNDDGEWTITYSTFFRTTVSKFKLGEDYDEDMPGGKLKNVTTLEEEKLVTKSVGPKDTLLTRIYEKTENGLLLVKAATYIDYSNHWKQPNISKYLSIQGVYSGTKPHWAFEFH